MAPKINSVLLPFIIISTVLVLPSLSLHRRSCEDNSENNTIYVIVLLPENDSYLASYNKVAPALQLTFRKIQEKNLLPGWKFSMANRDTGCDVAYGIWSAIEAYIENPVHLFLGPFCDYIVAPVARLLKFIEIPMVTSGALAYDFGEFGRRGNDSEYHLLVRTGWSFNSMALAMYKVFQRFNWNRLLFLYESDAHPEVMKEHYCFLAIKAVFEVLYANQNCTVEKHKLKPHESLEDVKKLATNYIGSKYGGKHPDSDLDILSPPVGQMMGGQCPLIEKISETGQWTDQKKASLHPDSDLDILSPPVGQMMGGQCPLIEKISETGQWTDQKKASLWLVSCVLFC
ncbi:atrial natriuretic peptide receptor 3 [Caerostris darwini]|uniref:Atrial natriuretic peptide receptor 3 n=1 Tax=Caerostris darwini TaxID=1538125 RepID=A0AAV4UQI2_9ARAC|nr:atrial natriuretic peptide receptor 3 [Caerostris darwini]